MFSKESFILLNALTPKINSNDLKSAKCLSLNRKSKIEHLAKTFPKKIVFEKQLNLDKSIEDVIINESPETFDSENLSKTRTIDDNDFQIIDKLTIDLFESNSLKSSAKKKTFTSAKLSKHEIKKQNSIENLYLVCKQNDETESNFEENKVKEGFKENHSEKLIGSSDESFLNEISKCLEKLNKMESKSKKCEFNNSTNTSCDEISKSEKNKMESEDLFASKTKFKFKNSKSENCKLNKTSKNVAEITTTPKKILENSNLRSGFGFITDRKNRKILITKESPERIIEDKKTNEIVLESTAEDSLFLEVKSKVLTINNNDVVLESSVDSQNTDEQQIFPDLEEKENCLNSFNSKETTSSKQLDSDKFEQLEKIYQNDKTNQTPRRNGKYKNLQDRNMLETSIIRLVKPQQNDSETTVEKTIPPKKNKSHYISETSIQKIATSQKNESNCISETSIRKIVTPKKNASNCISETSIRKIVTPKKNASNCISETSIRKTVTQGKNKSHIFETSNRKTVTSQKSHLISKTTDQIIPQQKVNNFDASLNNFINNIFLEKPLQEKFENISVQSGTYNSHKNNNKNYESHENDTKIYDSHLHNKILKPQNFEKQSNFKTPRVNKPISKISKTDPKKSIMKMSTGKSNQKKSVGFSNKIFIDQEINNSLTQSFEDLQIFPRVERNKTSNEITLIQTKTKRPTYFSNFDYFEDSPFLQRSPNRKASTEKSKDLITKTPSNKTKWVSRLNKKKSDKKTTIESRKTLRNNDEDKFAKSLNNLNRLEGSIKQDQNSFEKIDSLENRFDEVPKEVSNEINRLSVITNDDVEPVQERLSILTNDGKYDPDLHLNDELLKTIYTSDESNVESDNGQNNELIQKKGDNDIIVESKVIDDDEADDNSSANSFITARCDPIFNQQNMLNYDKFREVEKWVEETLKIQNSNSKITFVRPQNPKRNSHQVDVTIEEEYSQSSEENYPLSSVDTRKVKNKSRIIQILESSDEEDSLISSEDLSIDKDQQNLLTEIYGNTWKKSLKKSVSKSEKPPRKSKMRILKEKSNTERKVALSPIDSEFYDFKKNIKPDMNSTHTPIFNRKVMKDGQNPLKRPSPEAKRKLYEPKILKKTDKTNNKKIDNVFRIPNITKTNHVNELKKVNNKKEEPFSRHLVFPSSSGEFEESKSKKKVPEDMLKKSFKTNHKDMIKLTKNELNENKVLRKTEKKICKHNLVFPSSSGEFEESKSKKKIAENNDMAKKSLKDNTKNKDLIFPSSSNEFQECPGKIEKKVCKKSLNRVFKESKNEINEVKPKEKPKKQLFVQQYPSYNLTINDLTSEKDDVTPGSLLVYPKNQEKSHSEEIAFIDKLKVSINKSNNIPGHNNFDDQFEIQLKTKKKDNIPEGSNLDAFDRFKLTANKRDNIPEDKKLDVFDRFKLKADKRDKVPGDKMLDAFDRLKLTTKKNDFPEDTDFDAFGRLKLTTTTKNNKNCENKNFEGSFNKLKLSMKKKDKQKISDEEDDNSKSIENVSNGNIDSFDKLIIEAYPNNKNCKQADDDFDKLSKKQNELNQQPRGWADKQLKTTSSNKQNKKNFEVTEPHLFLKSLEENINIENCDKKAIKYITNFVKHRVELAQLLQNVFNKYVFNGNLPGIQLEWNGKLSSTAGFCRCRRKLKNDFENSRSCVIILSSKILDRPCRLRDTLIHEMCHAATWLIDKVTDGHGSYWKKWTRKALSQFPCLKEISTRHNYEIDTKYTYRCTECSYSFGRHKKTIDIKRKRCGRCYGKFQIFKNTTAKDGTKKQELLNNTAANCDKLNPFTEYVKNNYKLVSNDNPGLNRGDIMRLLSHKFALTKISN